MWNLNIKGLQAKLLIKCVLTGTCLYLSWFKFRWWTGGRVQVGKMFKEVIKQQESGRVMRRWEDMTEKVEGHLVGRKGNYCFWGAEWNMWSSTGTKMNFLTLFIHVWPAILCWPSCVPVPVHRRAQTARSHLSCCGIDLQVHTGTSWYFLPCRSLRTNFLHSAQFSPCSPRLLYSYMWGLVCLRWFNSQDLLGSLFSSPEGGTTCLVLGWKNTHP